MSTNQATFNALETTHRLASGALTRIHGIAQCLLYALETESGARNLTVIAEALAAIALDADLARGDIDFEAEKNGIETIDAAWKRRLNAMPDTVQAVEPVEAVS